VGVHDADLALLPEAIRLDKRRERARRSRPAGKERQAVGAESDVGIRLGCDRPDAGARPWDDGPDGQEPGLNRDAEVTCRPVARDDGVRHDPHLLSAILTDRRAGAHAVEARSL
jgi:hypothetical protein